jgi:hypothetical protein
MTRIFRRDGGINQDPERDGGWKRNQHRGAAAQQVTGDIVLDRSLGDSHIRLLLKCRAVMPVN